MRPCSPSGAGARHGALHGARHSVLQCIAWGEHPCHLTCHACAIQSAGVGGGEAPLTTYCLLLTAYCLLHRSEEAELSTGRRRSLKVTPSWRKASLGAPEPGPEPESEPEPQTRTLTLTLAITLTLAPNPNPNPNQGERGGECVCGGPRLGAPEQHRVPGQRRGSECGRSTQMQRWGVLLPSMPTPTPAPNTHRPHTNPYPP